ncbi:MAG: alanine dehydrogenase [Cytophagales bacterium]|nr:alanine dehydrogenase [Cytophagales bacterium]
MGTSSKPGFETLAKETALYPQEKLLEIKKGKNRLSIGIPKEIVLQENRIGLTPEGVGLLVYNGHEVWIETGAGLSSKFTDREYSEAGAKIVKAIKEVYEAEIIFKIEPPSLEEIKYMKQGQKLVSALQVANLNPEYLNALNKKKVIAVAFELIKDKQGGLPVVSAMGEVVGSTLMLIAAEYLSTVHKGKGIILGGITGVPPTKVIILGAGTVGEYAARAAIGLGAEVKVFDNNIYKLRRLKHNVGLQLYTSTIEPVALSQALQRADLAIGAMRAEEGRSPCVVSDEMVSNMQPGSVIIDVSIDQGGCFETSELTSYSKPVFRKYDVIHYCVPNIASRVARTASKALSHIFAPILLQIADSGGFEEMIFERKWFMDGVYAYKGSLTNAYVAKKFGMRYKELSLLMSARF